MSPTRRVGFRPRLAVSLALLITGCRSGAGVSAVNAPVPETTTRLPRPQPEPDDGSQSAVSQVGFEADDPASIVLSRDALPGLSDELSLDDLVSEVLRRNPTMQAAAAAWQAAGQRYPQAVALDDPMFTAMLGPRGLASDAVDGAYMVGVSQKVPWKGKRRLRGQMALWDYTAAQWDSWDVQVQLTEATKLAYFDYYLVHRQLEVNAANAAIMDEFRSIAQSRYEANRVPQQDTLQADVEVAQLARRRIELEQNAQIAIARINTLLHRQPDMPLLPPPRELLVAGDVPPGETLRQAAIQQRPDLSAIAARIQTERTAVELACKEFYPDFELMARYDAFWQEQPLRPMLGVNVNIPLNHGRRHAAVNEAIFKLSKMQAEYAQQVDAVQRDVQSARAKLVESRTAVALYSERILPAAEANVESARAGYESGQVDFLRLVEARRQLNDLQEQKHEAVAEYHSRLAELERIVGGSAVAVGVASSN